MPLTTPNVSKNSKLRKSFCKCAQGDHWSFNCLIRSTIRHPGMAAMLRMSRTWGSVWRRRIPGDVDEVDTVVKNRNPTNPALACSWPRYQAWKCPAWRWTWWILNILLVMSLCKMLWFGIAVDDIGPISSYCVIFLTSVVIRNSEILLVVPQSAQMSDSDPVLLDSVVSFI